MKMAASRKSSLLLTPLELKIMQVLWRVDEASVLSVQQALRPGTNLAYTSVQTMLNILENKNKVKRTLRGKAYLYRAAVSQKKISDAMLGDLIHRVFAGSADQLILTLIESQREYGDRIRELTRQVVQPKS
jgi:BlaI family transcriptional regulator, penicillinase repressor